MTSQGTAQQERQQWQRLLRQWSTEDKVCASCGTVYREAENVGRWQCYQHVASLDRHGVGSGPSTSEYGIAGHSGPERWLCCGKPVRGKRDRFDRSPLPDGCVECDHTTQVVPWSKLEDTALPKVRAKASGVCQSHVCFQGLVADQLGPDARSVVTLDAASSENFVHLSIASAQLVRYVIVRRYDWHEAARILQSGLGAAPPAPGPYAVYSSGAPSWQTWNRS